MAILKDLIVHGSSRFLNKIYADELETSAFEAESAIIKKLKADDATVVGLLDVQGQLHTNTWTNSNIATIDGCFYITPTLSSDSGNIVFSSVNVANLTGDFTAVNSLYIGDSSSGSTVQWTKDSKILLTGEVEVNGQWLPLGTLLGTLSENAATSSIGLKELKDNRHNDSSIITDIRNVVSNASLNYRNLKISLYQRKDGTDSKPLGIYMTAMGTNGKTFIDIYGGVNATTTAGSSGGFADPNLRIGNLSGLGAVEGTTPTGWGIYTTNGYFKGVIVSSAGKIGGFDIGTSSIKNTKTSYSETTNNGVWVGTDGIGLGKGLFYVTNAGALTAKSGSIAGWSFNTTSLYKTNATPGYNTSTMVISTGTASTNNIGGGGTASKTWMISAGTGFGVTTAGALYCNNAHISGEITATSGTIGGASITDGTLIIPAAQVSGELTAATINGSKITANSITAGQIAANAITADELAANAVTSAKIKARQVKATNIASSAVTADKLDATTINASNKLTVGALTTATQNDILNSNIQIGGENLLKNTQAEVSCAYNQSNVPKWYFTFSGNLPVGTYTISFDMKSSNGTDTFYCSIGNGDSTMMRLAAPVPTTTYTRFSTTFNYTATSTSNDFFFTSYTTYGRPTNENNTGTVYLKNIKLEKGNKATDWSPAPEDIDVHKYITDIDSNKGITIKPADTSGNDYLQMNSSAINFYRNNVETLKIEDSAIRVGKLGSNLRNVYITDSAVQIRNNTSVLAEYGSSIKLYQPTTTTVAVEISSTGASFTGNVKATSLSTGNKTASTTGKGTYIDGNGAIYVGNGSTNNFTVTDTGTITATGANLLTATIGNATNKITIGTGTSGHSSIRYGMTTLADTTNNGFYIGTDGIALGKGAFKVTAAGVLNATEATISGNITATSGTIGGASISDGILQITNTNISGTISANHIDASSLSIGISQVSNLQSTLDGKASTSAVTTAAGTASKYISVIDQNGITVHAENNSTLNYTKISSQAIIMYQNGNDVMNLKTNQFRIGTNAGNNIKIDANGITINNGSTQVASYKDSIILGDEANNNLLFLDKSSLSLRSGAEDYLSGNEVFEVGECAETISKTVTSGQASYQWSELANNTKEMKEVTLSGVLLEEEVDYTFNSTTGTVTLTNAPTNSTAKLKVSFIPINPEAIQKTITFTTPEEEYWLLRSLYTIPQHVTNIFSVSLNGTVLTSSQYSFDSGNHILSIPATPTKNNAPAAGSTVEVVYTKSLGYYYTLGKRDLTKIGDYSIATGYNCMAAGDKSFAGGNYTYVTGQSSFGYGYGTNDADCVQIPGNYCGGIGRGIIVRGTGNFGCGNYNVPSSSYIFSVGNGSSSTDRKNAFYVAKSGNARVAGTLTVMNGIQIAGQIRHYKTDGSGTVPLFWYDTKRKSNISVPANNTNTSLTCDITLPNRIPMGIVGMRILNSSSNGANASNCNLYIYMIVHNSSEDHVTFSIKNSASSAAKVDVEFKIFYIANEALNNQIEWT